jgi:hypothetical protein
MLIYECMQDAASDIILTPSMLQKTLQCLEISHCNFNSLNIIHHHQLANIGLGHLLTCSGLTHLQVSLMFLQPILTTGKSHKKRRRYK